MVDVAEALIEPPRKLAHRTALAVGEHDTLLSVHDARGRPPGMEAGRAAVTCRQWICAPPFTSYVAPVM